MINIKPFSKTPIALLGRRVSYRYLNKGKAMTGVVATISTQGKKFLNMSVKMDDGTVLTRSWKSFGLLN
nr:MAG TPA: hypothetical protein [Caudoviricetes sp.]